MARMKTPVKIILSIKFEEEQNLYFPNTEINWHRLYAKGSSINDVTVLGEGEGQRFCDDSTKALVIKGVTMGGGEGVSKIVQNRVTSLMDNPYVIIVRFICEISWTRQTNFVT